MTQSSNAPQSSDKSIRDWEAEAVARAKLHAELLNQNKAVVFDVRAAAGVTHVVISFDGYGDSGQIENVEVKAGEHSVALPSAEIEFTSIACDNPKPEPTQKGLATAIEKLVYDLLEETHCGWENNDGAYGDFTFDVGARTITLDYNERYTASDYTQHLF
jgi:hypothetical protein